MTNTFLAYGRFVNGSYKGATNGTISANVLAGTLNTGGGTLRMRFGASNLNTPSSFWAGTARQILFTKSLSDADTLRMEGYLAWDGGIQSVLP